jgi:hypothetical protein
MTVTGQNRLIEERERLTAAINDGSYREQHNGLYAARQALSWAIDPESAASPYSVVMGIHQEQGDYQGPACPL